MINDPVAWQLRNSVISYIHNVARDKSPNKHTSILCFDVPLTHSIIDTAYSNFASVTQLYHDETHLTKPVPVRAHRTDGVPDPEESCPFYKTGASFVFNNGAELEVYWVDICADKLAVRKPLRCVDEVVLVKPSMLHPHSESVMLARIRNILTYQKVYTIDHIEGKLVRVYDEK